ncbi:MAG: Fe(3+) ABC transporter substrate-binding protein [Balneolaceae bacterium]
MFHIRTVSLATLLIALFFLQSCTSTDEVNIYSSRHYETDLELYSQFTERTGVNINLIEGGSDELIARMLSEGVNSPADILITVDAGRLWRAQEAGVLQPIQSDLIDSRVPEELREPNGYWVGLSQRVRAVIYNRSAVDPEELGGYMDLADSKWRGRICVRSSNNIYNQSLVASMIEQFGEEETERWATDLVANFARPPQGGDTDQIRAVAAGQCDIALANQYYLARLADSSDRADTDVAEAVGIWFPSSASGGAHVNISGAGLTKHAPNRENAIKFLEYLTERESQMLFAGGNYEYPVYGDIDLPEVLQQFGPFDTDAVNVAVYGENNPDAIRLMDRAGWR